MANPMANTPSWQKWVAGGLLTAVYAAACIISFQWPNFQGGGASIWLPAGVGMAGLILGGVSLWPAVFLGRMVVGLWFGPDLSLWAQLAMASLNVLTAIGGIWLLQGQADTRPSLSSVRSMVRFVVGAALVPAALSALAGVVLLHIAVGLPVGLFSITWMRWAAGSAASVLVIVGAVLAWPSWRSARQWMTFSAVMVALAAVSWLAFAAGPQPRLWSWHLYPVLIWATFAYGVSGASVGLLVLSAFAASGIFIGVGPFLERGGGSTHGALFMLQQFLVLTAGTTYFLGAAMDERRAKAAALRAAHEELEALATELKSRVAQRDQALARSERALLHAQKLEVLGHTTVEVAHDFNNVLQTINNTLEVISRRPEGVEQVSRHAAIAKRAVQRGASLTGQLLALARRQKSEHQPLPIGELLVNMGELLRVTVGPAIEIQVLNEVDPGLRVAAAPTQIELIVLNLVVNARDAMPAGGKVTIVVAEHVAGAEDAALRPPLVRLSVRDTGEGMSPDLQARIFDPYFTTKVSGKGTGVGLSMVARVTKELGGRVSVESALGLGTTMTVILPCNDVDPQPAGSQGLVAAPATEASGASVPWSVPGWAQGLRVLVVDDDEALRQSIATMLLPLRFDVRQASTGPAALDQLGRDPPDLLVLDHSMPGMTGMEVISRMRTMGAHTPVVLASGDPEVNCVHLLGTNGFEFLRKPFSLDQLHGAMQKALASAANARPA